MNNDLKTLAEKHPELTEIQRIEMDRLEALGKALDIIYDEPEEE